MRVLSGIQPSGALHIGNYFAMMKRMIEYQNEHELLCFIVNYHALTTVTDPAQLAADTLGAAMDFLALGLDPDKAIFWVQGDVPEVCELTWILMNHTSVGLLERAHSYKDKIAKGFTPHAGLFNYPVLMAADILLYQAEAVPVGKDQKQHLEITRDIAARFNHTYGETFVMPEPWIDEAVATIPGIDGRKMSKSYGNTLEIFADADTLRKKVMRIVTDSTPVQAPKDPEKCNLFAIISLFMDEAERAQLAERYRAGGLAYKDVKNELFERMWAYFAPYRARRKELEEDPGFVREVLSRGAEKARAIAVQTMELVRNRVGLNY